MKYCNISNRVFSLKKRPIAVLHGFFITVIADKPNSQLSIKPVEVAGFMLVIRPGHPYAGNTGTIRNPCGSLP